MARDKRLEEYIKATEDLDDVFGGDLLDEEDGNEEIANTYSDINQKGRYVPLFLRAVGILPEGSRLSITQQNIAPSGEKVTERFYGVFQENSTIRDEITGEVYGSFGAFKRRYYDNSKRVATGAKKHYPDGWRDVHCDIPILGLGSDRKSTVAHPSMDQLLQSNYLELHRRGIESSLLDRKNEKAAADKLKEMGFGKEVAELDAFYKENPNKEGEGPSTTKVKKMTKRTKKSNTDQTGK